MVSPNLLRIVPSRPFNPSTVCSCVGPPGGDALGPVADEDLGPGADGGFFRDGAFAEGPPAEGACVGAVDVKTFAEFNAMAAPIPTIPTMRIATPTATKTHARRPPLDPAPAWGCHMFGGGCCTGLGHSTGGGNPARG